MDKSFEVAASIVVFEVRERPYGVRLTTETSQEMSIGDWPAMREPLAQVEERGIPPFMAEFAAEFGRLWLADDRI